MTKKRQIEVLLEIEAEAREKIRTLRAKNKALAAEKAELESEISALIGANEALEAFPTKADSENKRLRVENAELKERLSRVEKMLSAREKADRAFMENCCFALDFLGEAIKECNKRDEREGNRADFLLEANEMLAEENRRLRRKLGEPEKAVTLERQVPKDD